MTGRARNIEAFASAGQNFGSHRERHIVAVIVADSSAVEVSVLVQIAARHRTLDRRTGGAGVSKEVALRQGPVIRLDVHVLTASGGHGDQRQERGEYLPKLDRSAHG